MKTLSFEATFYPEKGNAYAVGAVGEDPQANGVAADVDPWATWYHHATNGWVDTTPTREAIAVPVDIQDVDVEGKRTHNRNQDVLAKESQRQHNSNLPHVTSGNNTASSPGRNFNHQIPFFCGGCCGLEGLLGHVLSLNAVITTFCIELSSAIIYCLAVGLYLIVAGGAGDTGTVLNTSGNGPARSSSMKIDDPESIMDLVRLWIRATFLLVVHTLMFVDGILLTTSIVVTEILAFVTRFITKLVGSADSSVWHRHIRLMCHLTRWAFRNFHKGWTPNRVFPLDTLFENKTSHLDPMTTATSNNNDYNTNGAGNANGTTTTTTSAAAHHPTNRKCAIVEDVVIVDKA